MSQTGDRHEAELARIIESARRLGVEVHEGEALQWLTHMAASKEGEEITIDYAMCDGSAYDEFDCECGSAICRGRVSGNDWRNPTLWERYAGHFSPYLQRRIDALKQQMGRRFRRKRGLVAAVVEAPGNTA